ncbi:MAG: hypothetical protein AAGI24_15855 [Pseudomonadota bacterium]
MKYTIRIREDWALLLLTLLLFGVSVTAAGKGYVFIAFIGFAFAGIVILIIHKQIRARWCIECQLPMQAAPRSNTDFEKLYYVCESCGKTNDSGIQLSWPE